LDRINGVLWDLDGVLFDTGEYHFEAWSQVLQEYHIPFSREIFKSIFGMKNDEAIPGLAKKPLSVQEIREIGERKEERFRELIRGRIELLPGVRKWLDCFRAWGCRQAVASSAPQANVNVMLAETDIQSFFIGVVASEGLPGKPDPAIFLRAADKIGVPAGECVVIEDAVAGIEAARRAGMKCIAVTTTNPARLLEKADMIVARLSDLTEDQAARLFGISV
jgi:beta-phosphoglucomutase family hydrolase